jgi:transposase
MEILYPRCAGLDVHKKTIVASRWITHPDGHVEKETLTFGTTTPELLRLWDWLAEAGVTHVAMESTGVYWKPVYQILEGQFELLVVNAQHLHRVPGRKKTDKVDAEWIAQCLRHGLLTPSFVPPQAQRDLRDLTRERTKLVEEQARVLNRIQKVLETANIKLASVATAIGGVSARAMLKEIVAGNADPEALAQLAQGRLRQKLDELPAALTGSVREHHRFLLREHLEHLEFLEARITRFNEQIAAQIEGMSPPAVPPVPPAPVAEGARSTAPSAGAERPPREPPPPMSYDAAIPFLDPLPGIDRKGAEEILAELGTQMRQFASAAHAASWTGIAPGNRESAGKRKGRKAPPGNKALRTALVRAARGAIRTKGSYFGALYHRIAARRGDKRATVAVARALLEVIYHMLLWQKPYEELGDDYFDQRDRGRNAQRLVDRLTRMGYEVAITARPNAVAA